MKILAAIIALAALGGCATTPPPYTPPAAFDYAHVWGGQAPEPYYSRAVALYGTDAVRIIRSPLALVEQVCGRNRDAGGWVQTACLMTGNATGTEFVVIASEVTDSVALRNITLHEIAHMRIAGAWPADHPGGLKPTGHLDNCLRVMRETGITVTQMRALCYLDGGAPLRTADERARWAAMR
jgi:hypothetical protein